MRYEFKSMLPGCCVPACLEMILARRGYDSPGQEQIGKELGFFDDDEPYASILWPEWGRIDEYYNDLEFRNEKNMGGIWRITQN